MVKGLLASEDRDFYKHFGRSLRGIAKSEWTNVRAAAWYKAAAPLPSSWLKIFI